VKIDKLKFRGKTIGVVLYPKIVEIAGRKPKYSCDVEVTGWKGKMSGDDYQSLIKYLKDEGYIEQAYSIFKD